MEVRMQDMNIPAILRDYGILTTVVIGLIGIRLTYIYTKRHYGRARRWEMTDRQFYDTLAEQINFVKTK